MSVKFELVKLEEAQDFVLSLPKPAMKKVLDNVHRIAEGERNTELFKKLEGTSEMELFLPYKIESQ